MNNFRGFSAKVMGEIAKLSKRIDNTVRFGEVDSVDSANKKLTLVSGSEDIPYVRSVFPSVGDLVLYATNAGDPVVLAQKTGSGGAAASTVAGTAHTLALVEADITLIFSNASLVTLTIPTESSVAFPVGTHVAAHSIGAGGLTLSTTGLTLNGSPNKTISTEEIMVLEKTGADTWSVYGGTSA